MNILLLIIIILYQSIEAFFSVKEINVLKDSNIDEKTRIKFYRETIIYGWIPVIIIAIFVLFKSLTINDIGIRAIRFSNYTWLNVTAIVLISAMSLLLIYQIVMFLVNEKYRDAIEAQVRAKGESTNHYERVINRIMTPQTIKEKVWFSFVSLTAGICEEITLRGTLLFLLHSLFPALNIVLLVFIASAIFGLLHSYQGIFGILKTGLIGIVFNLVYIVSGSLILGIIFHFLIDFSSAFLLTDKKNGTSE